MLRPHRERTEETAGRPSWSGIRFLLGYLRPYRWKFAISMVALLLSSVAGLAFPGLTGLLFDAVMHPHPGLLGNLNNLALVFVGILLAQSGFSYVRTYFLQEVSERSLADLRSDLYSRIVLLPIDFFHRNRVGDLTSRLTSDVTTIQTTITTTLSEMIRQTIILIGGITLVIWTSPRLTLVILVALPIVVALAVAFGRMIRKASRQVQDLYAELNTIAEETFQAISVVKAFSAEQREAGRFDKKLAGIITISLKVARARGAFIAFIVFLLFGGIVGVVWYGGRLVQSGELTIGELTSFVLYAVFVGGAMGSFADLYSSLQRALGSAERVQAILEEKPEPQSAIDAKVTPHPPGEVTIEGVSFAYPTRTDVVVLHDIDLHVPAGSSLALVGPSGSGKSTLANLLMRFYEPTEGRIIVDGTPIAELPLNRYRSTLAYVPQEVILFGGTIKENILYGNPEASDEMVREAADMANALRFIESFPDGFETVVGERGVQLSGGQRQRIAIARAILKNPAILILDEATSALDSESERLVQEALERVMTGRTTFVIAHRLSTIRNADRIAVLRDGRVLESGSWEDLIGQEGIFTRMVAMQSSGGALSHEL